MHVAMRQMNLSARAYHRTQSVKLARTIADLAGSEEIQSAHWVEALYASQSPEADNRIMPAELLMETQFNLYMGGLFKTLLHFIPCFQRQIKRFIH